MSSDGKCLFPDHTLAKMLARGSAIIHKCLFAPAVGVLGELSIEDREKLANVAGSFNLVSVLYANLELFDGQFATTVREIEEEFNALVTCDMSVTDTSCHTRYVAYTQYLANEFHDAVSQINALSIMRVDGLQEEIEWMNHPARVSQKQRIVDGILAVMEKRLAQDISVRLGND